MNVFQLRKNDSSLFRGRTLNSESDCVNTKAVHCFTARPCKRDTCPRCMAVRREYFCKEGAEFVEAHNLLSFVTIRFKDGRKANPWVTLFNEFDLLWRAAYRHPAPKFIRCLAIGTENDTPHVHFIVAEDFGRELQMISRLLQIECTSTAEPIYDVENLLGYLFDVNFAETSTRLDRPRGRRLLSASRGMPCGFPQVKKRFKFYKGGP